MRINDETLEDKRFVEKILRSLTRNFKYVVVAIEESNDLSSLSLERLLGTLQSHELRLKQFDISPIDQAFQTHVSIDRDKTKFSERRRGSNEEPIHEEHGESSSRGRGRGRPLSQVQCYHCQRYGHTIKFCRKKQAEERNNNSNFMHENEPPEPDTMFMTWNVSEATIDNVWYIDSACSNHMTGMKNMFEILDDNLISEVRTGDERKHKVQGKGSIIVNTKFGKRRIYDVYMYQHSNIIY